MACDTSGAAAKSGKEPVCGEQICRVCAGGCHTVMTRVRGGTEGSWVLAFIKKQTNKTVLKDQSEVNKEKGKSHQHVLEPLLRVSTASFKLCHLFPSREKWKTR